MKNSGNYWKLSLSLLAALLLCGLTPPETAAVKQARKELKAGAAQYSKVQASASAAQKRAAKAEQYAKDTYDFALKVQAEIDAAYKREQALVAEVNNLRDLKKRVYAYWGLGAFAVGFGILTKNLLILALVIAVGTVLIYVLSFAFPLFGIIWRVIWKGIVFLAGRALSVGRAGYNAIRRLFKRPPPAP